MSNNITQSIAAQFSGPKIRRVKESDTDAIARLFRCVYKDKYPFPDVFDGRWVKKCVHNDDVICLVLEENNEVVGSGALVMDVGNYNDQVGELGRFVVHPKCQGRGHGQKIINGLFRAAAHNVEFALGEARTAHLKSQRMVEKAGFQVIGLLPHYLLTGRVGESEHEKKKNENENFVIYGKLYGNGRALRSNKLPTLIPEIAPLASHVLHGMGLNSSLQIIKDAGPYPMEVSHQLREVNRPSLAQLGHIRECRLVEPLLFGKLSLDEGHSFVRRRNAVYLMAVDETQGPIGAIGFQFDETNQILIGLELIAANESVRGYLCRSLLTVADQFGARIIEVNVSAYDSRLQATFLTLGFKPLLYAPAMVFHGTERLDIVKMLRINESLDSEEMELTERHLTENASTFFSTVKSSLREFTGPSHFVDENQKTTTLTYSLSNEQFRFTCPNVRRVEESDAPEIIKLLKMTYGGDYPSPKVYRTASVRRCVHNRDMVGLVYVENEKVAASVALQFDYGRSTDQVGKISRFVVFARFNRDWVTHSLLKSVFEAAAENLEFVEGDLIVDSRFVQDQCELAGFSPLAYLPRYWEVKLLNRGVLPYGKLLGNGYAVRSKMIPQLIPEVEELARFILGDMALPTELKVEMDCAAYETDSSYELRPLDRSALARLARIEEGRLTEPLILGNVSLEQGHSMLRRKGAVYLVALDKAKQPVGTIGFEHDKTINVVKATELVGREDGLRGRLSEEFLRHATNLRARVIEVDVSAYAPRLQRTFFDLGFRPVGYFPARVFRGTERLDVVKMIKLNAPYSKPDEVMLTDKAERVVTLVEKGFLTEGT